MDCVWDVSSLLFLTQSICFDVNTSCRVEQRPYSLRDMKLSRLYEGCSLQSCDPVYLLEVCRRFGGTYCPLFKADDWQSKREAVGASETSTFVRYDIPKDGVLHSVYNSRLEFRGCPVLLPTAWRMLHFCILYTVYVVLYTFWHVAADCLNVVCVIWFGRSLNLLPLN